MFGQETSWDLAQLRLGLQPIAWLAAVPNDAAAAALC